MKKLKQPKQKVSPEELNRIVSEYANTQPLSTKSLKERMELIQGLDEENTKRLKEDASRLGFKIVQDRPGKFILWRVRDDKSPFMFRTERPKTLDEKLTGVE